MRLADVGVAGYRSAGINNKIVLGHECCKIRGCKGKVPILQHIGTPRCLGSCLLMRSARSLFLALLTALGIWRLSQPSTQTSNATVEWGNTNTAGRKLINLRVACFSSKKVSCFPSQGSIECGVFVGSKDKNATCGGRASGRLWRGRMAILTFSNLEPRDPRLKMLIFCSSC